jgi:hypothetical protein
MLLFEEERSEMTSLKMDEWKGWKWSISQVPASSSASNNRWTQEELTIKTFTTLNSLLNWMNWKGSLLFSADVELQIAMDEIEMIRQELYTHDKNMIQCAHFELILRRSAMADISSLIVVYLRGKLSKQASKL